MTSLFLAFGFFFFFFFFNDTATTEIYTLPYTTLFRSRRDPSPRRDASPTARDSWRSTRTGQGRDRKSTRLNSSHSQISYAVFCLKKKKKKKYYHINLNKTYNIK